ncbi:hypothetical protein FDECE_695 [Fusarium decemcellulare]|nr:hypothetical protein FDECE_695 [Fusarium decemcellulare]
MDIAALLIQAQEEFSQSLSYDERKSLQTCQSPEDLLQSIDRFVNVAQKRRCGKALLHKIKNFSDKLSPYFKIIDIFCSIHPEWANIAWGALRLILQLASNFGTFFEKLCEHLGYLSDVIPRFHDVYTSLNGDSGSPVKFSPRLPEALVRFYQCLFDFFHAVARVFTKKDGSLKKTPVYVMSIMIQPFESRFQDILQRMRACQDLVQKELDLALLSSIKLGQAKTSSLQKDLDKIYQQVFELNSNITEMQQDHLSQRILEWISPPLYKSPFEKAKNSQEPETAEWLLDEPKFQAWNAAESPQSSPMVSGAGSQIIWVNGNPGSGKTVLAASTIDFLTSSEELGNITCYYFFDATSANPGTRYDAWRAIVAQLYKQSCQIEQVRDIFSLAVRKVLDPASEEELLDVLRLCAAVLPRVSIVADGIDECAEATQFFHDVCRLCDVPRVRVALFSRPNVAPIRQSSLVTSIQTNRKALDRDIAKFFNQELVSLMRLGQLPRHAEPHISSLTDHLVYRSDGMFLWARLMITYLQSPALTPAQKLRIAREKTPERINNLYLRIFDLIRSLDEPSQRLARKIFLWCGHAYNQLTAQELHAVTSDEFQSDDDELVDMDNVIIITCGGLVEKRSDGTFHFIHLTAKEFMSSNILTSPSGIDFAPSPARAMGEIARTCLTYLNVRMPASPLSGDMSRKATVDELVIQQPFLSHAVLNWCFYLNHMLDMDRQESLSSCDTSTRDCLLVLEKFFTLKLNIMAWLEAFFTLTPNKPPGKGIFIPMDSVVSSLKASHVSLCQISSSILTASLDKTSLLNDLEEFAHTLNRINNTWGDTLCHRPQEIWNDVTLFTVSRFLQPTAAAIVQPVETKNLEDDDKGDPKFFISASSTDGQRMGVLQVWPSPLFNMLWSRPSDFCDYVKRHCDFMGLPQDINLENAQQAERFIPLLCPGWTAQFQVSKLGNSEPEMLYSTDIEISEQEIALQLRQSFRQGPLGEWKLYFPMAISPSLAIVVVLRTVYAMGPDLKCHNVNRPTSLVLNSADIDPEDSNWSNKRRFFELPYSYKTKVGCDDKFLLLQEEDPRLVGQVSVVVFCLIVNARGIEAHCVNRLSYKPGNEHESLCELHWQQPWLIFVASSSLQAWNLQEAKLSTQAWPTVLPLPHVQSNKRTQAESHDGQRKRHKKAETCSELALLSGLAAAETSVVVGDNRTGSLYLNREVKFSGVQSVQLHRLRSETQETASLVSLPSDINLRTLRPSVRETETGEEYMLVMNKQQLGSFLQDTTEDGSRGKLLQLRDD